MRFKATLFDLDGTLLNTLDDLADTGNATLASLHYPVHPTDSYRYFVGDGMRVLIMRILPATCSEEQISECERIFQRIYAAHWADKSRPYTGIEAMIFRLREMGLKLAILSNKPDDFTGLCVDRFFPAHTFDCVRGQQEGVPKKPDPAGALIISERLGMEPADILYVGDTATDMQTGKSAGMKTAGVLWGFRELLELEKNGADYIVSHPQEIVKICQ
jgi:phosphoglycolate phosphatase